MKKHIPLAVFALLVTSVSYAQPPAGAAHAGDTYGAKINANNVDSWKNIADQLTRKDTVSSKIEGKVLASCPKKGCWMRVELPDKTRMFVKFKDYAFFVPTAIVGKTVILDGIAFNETTSVEELKHYAKDAQKPQSEIDAITQPQKQVRFLADGVQVQK
ncbi:MAG: DUF4920 domain-containing protein [Niabella sp.]